MKPTATSPVSSHTSELDECKATIKDAVEVFSFQFLKGRPGLSITKVAVLLRKLGTMNPDDAEPLVDEFLDRIQHRNQETGK